MMHYTDQSIISFLVKNNIRVMITFVNVKCTYVARRELWVELDHRQHQEYPQITIGDFNAIRKESERIGRHPTTLSSISKFNDCLDHCGLFKIQSIGNYMSWCNGHEGTLQSWAKLDRALINTDFPMNFDSAKLKYLPQKTSITAPC